MAAFDHRPTAPPVVPDGVPLLGRGSHPGPTDGACLLEYVSVLAGERFSDRPDCVHPLLAAVGRVVNDRLSDRGRQELVCLAPDLVGTAAVPAEADPALTALAAAAALVVHPQARAAARLLSGARRRLRAYESGGPYARTWLRTSAPDYRIRSAYLAAQLTHEHVAAGGDHHLLTTLRAVSAECRRRMAAPDRQVTTPRATALV